MPYTMEDLERDAAQSVLQEMTPEQRLALLTPEQILGTLPREVIENYLKKLQPSQGETSSGQPEQQS